MAALEKMRDRLNSITDPELLDVAKEVLLEMAELVNLRQQLEMREARLTEGKRAGFYFFALDLSSEELAHAASTAGGRVRFLKEKKERESYGKAEPEQTEEKETSDIGSGYSSESI